MSEAGLVLIVVGGMFAAAVLALRAVGIIDR